VTFACRALQVIEGARRRWPLATAIVPSGDAFDPRLQTFPSMEIKLLRKPVTIEKQKH
jgi:hypothetical protein